MLLLLPQEQGRKQGNGEGDQEERASWAANHLEAGARTEGTAPQMSQERSQEHQEGPSELCQYRQGAGGPGKEGVGREQEIGTGDPALLASWSGVVLYVSYVIITPSY